MLHSFVRRDNIFLSSRRSAIFSIRSFPIVFARKRTNVAGGPNLFRIVRTRLLCHWGGETPSSLQGVFPRPIITHCDAIVPRPTLPAQCGGVERCQKRAGSRNDEIVVAFGYSSTSITVVATIASSSPF